MTSTGPGAAASAAAAGADSDGDALRALLAALDWYTGAAGLAATPVHRPLAVAPGAEQCSCGKPYGAAGEAARGAGLAACDHPGKHPVYSGFSSDRSKRAETPGEAHELWAGQLRNVGLVTGKPTGLVVFDVDARAGGPEQFWLLDAAVADLSGGEWQPSSALRYLTSSSRAPMDSDSDSDLDSNASSSVGAADSERGFHCLWRADRDDPQLWRQLLALGNRLLPGVELKTRPGIVVAAPSLHPSGEKYCLDPRRTTNSVPELTPERVAQLAEAAARLRSPARAAPAAPDRRGSGGASSSEWAWAGGRGYEPGAAGRAGETDWGAAVAAASGRGEAWGGDLTWRDAATDRDSRSNPGHWSRQLSHLLLTGRPARTFGPGDHNEPLTGLVGAVARLIFADESFARECAAEVERVRRSSPGETWLPAVYASLCLDVDAAVTKPKPWAETDRDNLEGLMKHAMVNELRKRDPSL